MIYGVLAELLLFVHLTLMKFVAVGGFLVLRWRWLLWVHLPAAILAAVMVLAGWFWPFAGLEHWLRERGAQHGYTQNLVERFLPTWLHPATMPRTGCSRDSADGVPWATTSGCCALALALLAN